MQAQTAAQKKIGDFGPKLASLTDDVVFGDVWQRVELSPHDRSLMTVVARVSASWATSPTCASARASSA
jgi:4-carboxymuconolactone decarboxylase